MKPLLATLLLCLAFTRLATASLPPDKAAALDGSYTAINQRTLTAIQRSAAQGHSTPTTAKDIEFYTNAINQAKARYANSPYKKLFDQGYQDDMAKAAAAAQRPVAPGQKTGTTGGGGQVIDNPQPYQPPAQPFAIPFVGKVILFFAAVWGCRKLWNMPAGSVSKVNLNAYAPVELPSGIQQELGAAQQRMDQRLAQIEAKAQSLQRQMQQSQTQLATVAARVKARADGMTTAAANDLNRTVPEYENMLANLEQRSPATMAPWTSAVWKDFEVRPKLETPWNISIARFQENLLPAERGLRLAKTVPLLAAKGPIVVRCDPASKDRARAVIHNILVRAALAAPAEISFSLIDPAGIGAGFPMRGLLPRVRRQQAPADELAGVIEDIRRINEGVVRQSENFASLTREQRAGEVFEIIAVLDYPAEYQRDSRAPEAIARIGQAGPHAGRHLILEWNVASGSAEMPRFQNQVVIDVAGAPANWQFEPAPPAGMLQSLIGAVDKLKSESTGGDWDSLVQPARFFSETSERMVATLVGERLKFWFGENQDGKPCMHGMLAGQSGSGKSSLLHVLITGLAAHYSPEELQLVLVDGKEGVEFAHYRQLPHAQVVCLKTPPSVARAVLADYVGEMSDRWEKFGRVGVQKLEDYRRKTGLKMPRMVMVVDEFQQLLVGDQDRGAELLNNILQQGRAAGVHILLASQNFEVRGLPPTAMAQVPLRASLMLASDYVNTISAFGAEGKKLISTLSQGQVVINDESGWDGANNRGAVARLNSATGSSLTEIVARITAAAGGPGRAVVLTGQDPALLAENPFVQQWKSAPPDAAGLQLVAKKKVRDGGFEIADWITAERPVPLWLGRKFDVRGHVVAVLRRQPNNNLLAIGSNSSLRLCMLANALAGLRSIRPVADCEVLFLDGVSEGQAGEGMVAAGLEILRQAGARVERATPENAAAALETFAASAAQPRSPESLRLLVLSEPEYFNDLAGPQSYGALPTGAAKIFKDLLKNGSKQGIHCLVTASGLRALTPVVGIRELGVFSHRVAQQTNGDESVDFCGKGTAAQIKILTDHPMGAMYIDWTKGVSEAQFFKSYAATADTTGDQTAADLAKGLQAIYAAGRQGAGA